MPSDNTGNQIIKIEVRKKKIFLYLEKDVQLTLTADQFTQDYYYVGKFLTEEKIQQLINQSHLQPLIDYGFRLLSKGLYSEYQVRVKLYARDATKPQVDHVINRLKQAHLLDDATLLSQWVVHFQKQGYGPNVIRQKLIEKGFSKPLIETMKYDDDKQEEVLPLLIQKLLLTHRLRSQKERNQLIFQALIKRGFDNKTSQRMLKQLPLTSEEEEKKKLQLAFQKATRQYGRRFKGKSYQEKVINFLLRKGYTYSNIRDILKENQDVD